MAPLNLCEFKISEETPTDDVRKLMKLVKPEWEDNAIEIKKMTGGHGSATYHCYLHDNPDEGVTVRIHRLYAKHRMPLVVEGYEEKTVQLLSERDLFPKVLATFQDGYCYEYIPGKVIVNVAEMKDNFNLRVHEEFPLKCIAKKLVTIHSLKMEGEDYSKSEYFDRILLTLVNHYADIPEIPAKEIIKAELQELIKYGRQLPLQIGLCHGDCHPGNMIWNDETDEVTIIDWSGAHTGYQVKDVAHFVGTYTLLEFIFPPDKSPPQETIDKLENHFINFYYEESSKLGLQKLSFTDFYNQVKFFKLLHYLLLIIAFGSWFVGEGGAEFNVDSKPQPPSQLIHQYFNRYKEQKESVLQLLGFK